MTCFWGYDIISEGHITTEITEHLEKSLIWNSLADIKQQNALLISFVHFEICKLFFKHISSDFYNCTFTFKVNKVPNRFVFLCFGPCRKCFKTPFTLLSRNELALCKFYL